MRSGTEGSHAVELSRCIALVFCTVLPLSDSIRPESTVTEKTPPGVSGQGEAGHEVACPHPHCGKVRTAFASGFARSFAAAPPGWVRHAGNAGDRSL